MLRRTRISLAISAACGAGLLGLASPVAAQTQQLEKVEITGSSIKRIDAETALPVQIITREDIQRTGVTSTEQLLQTITAAGAAGNTVSANNAGANTGGLSTVSLRNLGATRTLVLINGRRSAPYGVVGDSSSVDVGSIPIAAIERVEVLKDGASAVYGSDAIAGVINFILRKDYQGAGVSAEYGRTISGGGAVKTVTGTYGFGDLNKDRFNFNVLATYQKQDAIYGADRDYAKSGINVGPNDTSTLNNDVTSGNTFPGNIATLDGTTIGNPRAGNCGPYSVTSPLNSPSVCRYDPSPFVSLLPESENWSLMGNGRFALNSQNELFAELSYTHRDILTIIQPNPLSDQFALPSTNPLFNVAPYNGADTFQLNPSSPYYPGSYIAGQGFDPTQPVLVRYRAVENGLRQTRDVAESPRIVLGLNGSGMGWDYRASYLYTQNKLTESTEGGFPVFTKVLPLLNSGLVNPFGPSTPDIQAALLATNYNGDTYVNKTTLQSLNVGGGRDLFQLPAGPLAIALGAEARRESYDAEPSQLLIQGDVAGYGGNQAIVDVSRNVYSGYGEVNIPIIKGLEADLAGRYDDYQNVGNKATGKASARWTPISGLLVRGAYGTGFRAPSLTDLYSSNTSGVSVNGVSDPLRCPTTGSSTDCTTQFATTLGGNRDLKPETSKNYTLGFVLEPSNAVSLGADFWWINIKNTILIGGISVPTILSNLGQYGSLVTRGPSTGGLPGPIIDIQQTNANAGSTSTKGFDVNGKWRLPSNPYGRFTLGFDGTYTAKYDITLANGAVDHAAGAYSSNIPGPIPRWKQYTSLTWQAGAFNTTLAQRYQSAYQDVDGDAGAAPGDPGYAPHVINQYQTWDIQTVWTAYKGLQFTLGIRNMFDRQPPYSSVSANGGQFQAGYDISYVDVHDRFMYGRVSYDFK